MKKFLALLLTLAIAFTIPATLAGCSGSSEKTLNIFTWADYIPKNVLDNFTKSTGIKIHYSNFETNEEMLSKLKSVKGGDYDIVIASDYIINIARKDGSLLGEIDKSKIPNYKNINPQFQSQYYDPDNKYTIPYVVGTPLIVYDPAKVKIDIQGYNDLWDPALKNSVVMMDDERNVVGITLKALGHSFNTTDKTVLSEAREKLLKLKPNIRALDGDNPQKLIESGDASVGYMFTSQVVEALQKRPDLKVVYPKEGMGFGIDNALVPKNAPHKDNAYKFINYILDAKVGADISSQILYICPNQASTPYLPKSFLDNKALYIPKDVLGKTEFIQDVDSVTTKTLDQMWTDFKQE